MNLVTPSRWSGAALLALGLPALVQAHGLHGSAEGLLAGCAHPATGWDHLLAMVAVGLWAAHLGGRARWALPAAFVSVMAAGAACSGMMAAGAIEPMILASLFVLGLLLTAAVRLPTVAGAALVAVFAFFHGAAHGAEMPPGANSAGYFTGFMGVTTVLVGAGLLLGGAGLRRASLSSRLAGAALALTGLVFI